MKTILNLFFCIFISSCFLNSSHVYISDGLESYNKEKYNEAIIDFNKALIIDTNNAKVLYLLGKSNFQLKKYNEAIIDFNKAFKTKGAETFYLEYNDNSFLDKPEFDIEGFKISFERGMTYFQMDSFQLSILDFENAISHNYNSEESMCWIGLNYKMLGNKTKSCEYYKKSAKFGFKLAQFELNEYCK
jgi:tetratricopeptide (TPR) repeat protein